MSRLLNVWLPLYVIWAYQLIPARFRKFGGRCPTPTSHQATAAIWYQQGGWSAFFTAIRDTSHGDTD